MTISVCAIVLILVSITALLVLYLKSSKESYRDPLYISRAKLTKDYYPKANGSIYGFPYRYGGSWSISSGFPYYDKAY